MRTMKKFLALTIAATMIVGSGVTALADGPVTGAGSSEGHVDKDVMDFVLPTTDATTFAFSMDPERLIAASIASGKAKADYTGATFPTENDTGVYFLTGTKTYANTSKTVQAINKGAGDATLTVKTKYIAGSKDITMATAALTASETTAKLYLAASIGGKTQILTDTDVDTIVVLPGNKANYEVVYDGEAQTPGYKFVKKTSGLTAWKAVNINLTGAVTDGIAVATDTTAPSVQFTWTYAAKASTDNSTEGVTLVDYSDAPANPTITGATAVSGQNWQYTMTYTKGQDSTLSATGLTAVQYSDAIDGEYKTTPKITVEDGTATILGTNFSSAENGDVRYFKVTINNQNYIIKVNVVVS
ncbi:hypothetical protein [Butyrivibrio sp. MB2005]|uniref:hypothetical protein n=1 Tax=Butyrivibrio sp. MB2005 TaxID=1280678 RepID=UPI0003F8303D|nr:hypothetical protein [Butyrivibrio sp. MB2005]